MQTNQTIQAGNPPEKKFRAGAIAATVWKNNSIKDGKPVSYRTVSIGRSYKDKTGAWQNTNSMRVSDLPRAALVLEEAFKYIVLNGEQSIAEEQPVLA